MRAGPIPEREWGPGTGAGGGGRCPPTPPRQSRGTGLQEKQNGAGHRLRERVVWSAVRGFAVSRGLSSIPRRGSTGRDTAKQGSALRCPALRDEAGHN